MNPPDTPARVLVIGGGVTGLAAAHRLIERSRAERRPISVQLLEASERLGGVIRTVEREGFLLEAGPDSFVNEHPWARQLCERLGLRDELVPTNPRHRHSFVARRGQLFAVPDGFYLLAPARLGPFLATPLLSPAGKLRAALELCLPSRRSDEDESIAAFVRRRFGGEVLERLAEPLISGMASGDVERLSMRAVLPHVVEMERRHSSVIRALRYRRREQGQPASPAGKTQADAPQESAGARYGLFVSLRQGMQALVDRLVERLPRENIRLRTCVARLTRDQATSRWTAQLDDGALLDADAVCLAVPTFCAAELLRETDAALAALLERLVYSSWITINLAYRRADMRQHPMDGFGFVVPAAERLPIVGGTFAHVKFFGRAPDGEALIRAFVRTDDRSGECALDDAELERAAHRALSQLLGISAAPRFAVVHRAPRSLPQYHVGHLAWVAGVRQALALHPTLALAGNAFTGHGITHCIHSGELAADALLDRLSFAARHDTLASA